MTAPSVTIDRTGLSLSPLVISGDPTGNAYWFEQGGLTEPDFDLRNTFADESPDVAGSLLLQSVQGLGTLALTVCTTAANGDDLKAQKRALEAALRQFSYTVTVQIIGAADTYNALPSKVSWGPSDASMVNALTARGAVSITLQPLGA